MRLEKCDAVIFLDLPRLLCIYRILKRVALYKKGSRPDMADGCDERFDWEFVKIVWNYPTRSKPKVEALLHRFESEKTIFRLHSQKEIEDFFVNIVSLR
jgi:adenylate kinase family enzyme